MVSVAVSELLLPSLTFPKFRLDVLSPRIRVAATPVPLSVIVSGDAGALLTSCIDPVTLPAELGPKTALNVAVLPAAIVTGAVIPEVLNPAPVVVTDEIVTLALPPFVRVKLCELLVPVVTLPNVALVGVAASAGCVPVPLKAIAAGEPGALLTIEMLPAAAPAPVGVKMAEKDALLPALMDIGILAPLTLNPLPEGVACVTVNVAVPAFVSVIVCVPLLPTATLPNAALAGLIVS